MGSVPIFLLSSTSISVHAADNAHPDTTASIYVFHCNTYPTPPQRSLQKCYSNYNVYLLSFFIRLL